MKFLRISKALLLIVVIATGIFVACNKEQATVATVATESSLLSTEGVTLQENRLVFKDRPTFDKVFGSLSTKDLPSLRKWENRIPSFTSMRTAYDNISEKELERMSSEKTIRGYENIVAVVEEEADKGIVLHTENNALATLVNPEGIVQIGSDVFKVNRNYIYSTNIDNISKLQSSVIDKNDKDIKVYPVTRTQENTNFRFTILSECFGDTYTASNLTWNHRLWGYSWQEAGFFKVTAGIKSLHRKKTLWWVASTTTSLTVAGTGSIKVANSFIFKIVNFSNIMNSCSECSEVTVVPPITDGILIPEITSLMFKKVDGIHTAVGLDKKNYKCTTSYVEPF